MVKPPPGPAPTGPGIYSATYSGIPVYEFQFGADLKEHVMRRRQDNWINATHILKAAGFDKPARTRILEREVQKDTHEKIQGGYGKYQGTWIPLEAGEQLAHRNNIFERLRPIFEFIPGAQSPPPAPRHASKPKQPKAKPPAVPKWGAAAPPPVPEEFESASQQMNEDDTPDNVTVASASYMAEDDHHDMSHYSTGHRKRKREEAIQDLTDQQHSVYGDELLDYFLLSRQGPTLRPEPPPNFQPDYFIDTDRNTSLHWASAMGDIDVMKQLKRFGASLNVQNIRGETPFMRAVYFTNCYEKQTFPAVMKELFDTVDVRDDSGCTVLHHAVMMKSGRVVSHSCSRYYLDNILNRLQETHDPNFFQHFLDAQDNKGNTALHLAAQANARKCIRALLGRGASTDIVNTEGVRAEELIQQLNATKGPSINKEQRALTQRSSSPFAPDSQRHVSFRDALHESVTKHAVTYHSTAANTVQNDITPLVLQKFQDLAQSYEEEWKEKNEAEVEARRILGNAQNELAAVRQQIAEIEAKLEPEDVAAKAIGDATMAQHHLLALLANQNRHHVKVAVDGQLASALNGSSDEDSPELRLQLAQELRAVLEDQRHAEREYVDALGLSVTGEKIDKYRRLLKQCLDHDDAETLDANLDDLIGMMEEQRSEGDAVSAAPAPGEVMMIC
ncbi:transcription factor MBP1 [Xylariales sp. PMI_506]|nr:transcription factor MBP1 [Xylariales sp. PMI_506]